MRTYLIVLAFVLASVAVSTAREPKVLTEVRKLYAQFRDVVPDKYAVLRRQVLLIGYLKKEKELGYNTNKGYEICLCLDGTANQVFHVLLHELAHSTVKEYDHNDAFWNNFKELREIATAHGLYTPIVQSEQFCGKAIKDQ
jgi:hypothetical protein